MRLADRRKLSLCQVHIALGFQVKVQRRKKPSLSFLVSSTHFVRTMTLPIDAKFDVGFTTDMKSIAGGRQCSATHFFVHTVDHHGLVSIAATLSVSTTVLSSPDTPSIAVSRSLSCTTSALPSTTHQEESRDLLPRGIQILDTRTRPTAWPTSVRRECLQLGRDQFDKYAYSVSRSRGAVLCFERDPQPTRNAAATASTDIQGTLGAFVAGPNNLNRTT